MKYFVLFSIVLVTLISCTDKEFSVDATISIDKVSYGESDTVKVDFSAKANQSITYIEAKILDENSITASAVSNVGVNAKEVSGQLKLNFLDQFHEAGNYTVQVTFGSADDTHREFEEFNLNTGALQLSGFLISETTLGNSNVHLVNHDGIELLVSESQAIDLLGTNFTYDQFSYGINDNMELNLHSIPNGNVLDFLLSSPSSTNLTDGTSDNTNHYLSTDNGLILKSPINGSSLTNRSYNEEITHIVEQDDYLVTVNRLFNSSSYRATVILKSTLFEQQDFNVAGEIMDLKKCDDRIFVLTSSNIYELDLSDMTLDQISTGFGMTSIAGLYGDILYINQTSGYRTLSLNTFIGQEIGGSFDEILVVPNNNWLVKNYGDRVEVCNISSDETLATYNMTGTAVEMMLMD